MDKYIKNDFFPKEYEGYNVQELLLVLKEIQGDGTKAPREMIIAMRRLVREFKLVPVFQMTEE